MSIYRSLRVAIERLRHERLLVFFVLLALALALLDPRPASRWLDWLNWPTLAGLTGLLVAIQGIGDSNMAQRAAEILLSRLHSVRAVGVALIIASALLATVLTNDVSLFLVVPLTLALGREGRLPLARLVTLEAFAVNAGSTLSPIGNPQNLLLWRASGLPFTAFVHDMLPAAAVMLGLTLLLAIVWLPGRRLPLVSVTVPTVGRALGTLSIVALTGMVLALECGRPLVGAVIIVAAFALGRRRTLCHVDWGLLLTFAAIFLALGHLSAWPPLAHLLDGLNLGQSLPLYVTGIVGSQIISNVPASVLLVGHTPLTMNLAVAVNVGGYGCVIGSLANLIALRLARGRVTMMQFHRVSVPFLLVCAVLVYLVLQR